MRHSVVAEALPYSTALDQAEVPPDSKPLKNTSFRADGTKNRLSTLNRLPSVLSLVPTKIPTLMTSLGTVKLVEKRSHTPTC